MIWHDLSIERHNLSERLIQRDQGVAPTFSFEDDRDADKIVFDFYDSEPSDNQHYVVAYQQFSDSLTLEGLNEEFITHPNATPEEDEFIREFLYGVESAKVFKQMPRYNRLLSALGYKCLSETAAIDGAIHSWTAFSYPTPNRLNTVLDEVSPNEGLRYEYYPGGEYSALDFADALDRNKVLIAEDMPDQLHDHVAMHILGYMGLHGEMLDKLKANVSMLLQRSKAEAQLPPAPRMDKVGVYEFFHPSHTVIRQILFGMDTLSSEIANAVLEGRDTSHEQSRPTKLARTIRYFYEDRRPNEGSLSSILDTPTRQQYKDYAAAIEERYDRLNTLAGEIV